MKYLQPVYYANMKQYTKNSITKKESELVKLLEKGYSNKSISDHLKVSENTVKFHLKNIYKKLGAHNRLEAIYKLRNN